MTLHDLQRRLSGFSLIEEIKQTILTVSDDILELNRQQLAVGLLATDEPIQNLKTGYLDYSIWWGRERRKKGLQTEFYDLKFTGNLYEQMNLVSVTDEEFVIYNSADTMKVKNLIYLFGKEIFGLTDESSNEFITDILFPELQYRIEQKLGISFD